MSHHKTPVGSTEQDHIISIQPWKLFQCIQKGRVTVGDFKRANVAQQGIHIVLTAAKGASVVYNYYTKT